MKRATKIATVALLIGAGAATLPLTAAAFGGKGGHGKGGMMGKGMIMQMEFADLDADKNGQLTLEDLQAHSAARFATADADGNGSLSLEEMKAQASAKMKERMANGNGEGKERRYDPAKAEKRMGWMVESMMEKRDADKDGALSLAEATPEISKLERMIDRFDTDDDNAISAAEFDAAQKEMWQRGKHGKNGGHGKHGHGGKGGN